MANSADFIPFNRASIGSAELARMREAVDNGHISGNGSFSQKTEEILSGMHDGARVLLTPSCSSALELAARLIRFEPGDEVIVPSFTFVTSVSSFISHGATPVFCDIDPITLGLDLAEARKLISPKTKAIVLVHYGGTPANPEGFAHLAAEHGLILVEDNAHGLGGRFKGRALGTFGAMSTLSFHETKNISCGEGGALVINDNQFVDRAEILREKGTDRTAYFLGQVDKYTWQDLGSSWVLSDILAAALYSQLLQFPEIQNHRQTIWETYFTSLDDWALENNVSLPPPGGGTTAHLFFTLFEDFRSQRSFITHLSRRGIAASFHYMPLHNSPFGSQYGRQESTLPITVAASQGLVRLPLHRELNESDQSRVIKAVRSFRVNR